MGHYFSEMRSPDMKEELEAFTSDNRDKWFVLVAGTKQLSIRRSELVEFLAKYRKDHNYLGQIRALVHELAK
jgi:hypothetical protein